MSERPDEELIAASVRGDRAAFDELVLRHGDAVLSYLRGLTLDFDAARDLAQETFLAAWKARKRFAPKARVRTWIFTIARNRWVDWVRRRAHGAPEAGESVEAPPAYVEIEKREEAERALTLMGTLPDAEREILALRVLEGLSYGEISELTGVEENAARAYASRAVRRLREALRGL